MAFHNRLCMLIFSAALVRIESSPPSSGRALIGRGAQGADACGSAAVTRTVRDDPDIISSAGYPGFYPANTTCTWKLRAPPGKRINITSNFINLERSAGCLFDHVIIYDGDSELSVSLGRYCGNTPISLITSSNNALVKMVSDRSYTRMGFELSYSATTNRATIQRASPVYCNSIFRTSPGLVTSPEFPLPSEANTYCQYTFQAPVGKHVELVFNFFHLEQSTFCQFDKLEIFDGQNKAGGDIGTYCGRDQPPLVRSSGRYLFLTYTTDGLYRRGGFNVSYQFVSPNQDPLRLNEGHSDCSKLIESESRLSSPGYPGFYPNNKACVYVLRAPLGQFVQITFEAFKMEKSDHCALDSLSIYDGSSHELPASYIFCGEQVLPGTAFTSKGREYRLVFKSDYSSTEIGFLLNATFVSQTTGTVCNLQCQNKGECVQQQSGPMCDCQPPYSGDRCQTAPSDCGSGPCLNGGTCENLGNSYRCHCPKGLKGDYCQFDATEKLKFNGPIEVPPSLRRGAEAYLECRANTGGLKGAHIEWIYEDDISLERGSHENKQRSVIVYDGGLLQIISLGPRNTGKYTCVVTDGVERIQQHAFVNLDEPCNIEVANIPKNATETVGKQTHLLKCRAKAGPLVKYQWLKDDRPLPGNSTYQVLSNNFLKISNLDYVNAGKFTCEIIGDKCAKRYTVYLTVVGDRNLNKVCGKPTMSFPGRKQAALRIAGGKAALDGSYPWHALLYDTVDRYSFCGGSIINNRWIVTAAHCLKSLRPDGTNLYSQHTTKIMVGTTNCKGDGGRALNVDIYIIHEGYGPDFDNDIALVRVKEVIDFTPSVRPICLESQSFNDVEFFRKLVSGYVAGCGSLRSNSQVPAEKLMEVMLPIQSRQVCVNSLKSTGSIMTESMFCAGFSTSSRGDACQGDSGGGYVFKSRDRFVLVGVISWGIGCDEAGQYGFYTDVGRFFNWIHKSIN